MRTLHLPEWALAGITQLYGPSTLGPLQSVLVGKGCGTLNICNHKSKTKPNQFANYCVELERK